MREKAKKIVSKERAELTKIINTNLNKFRTPRVFHIAMQHVTNMSD